MHPHILSLPFILFSSFGFTEKGSGRAGHQAIGVYGNGFKSGSMRLGRDALIFTKNGGCQTLGMLSQTYLENIKAQAVIVPIVPFNQQTNILYETVGQSQWLVEIFSHVCHFQNLFYLLTLTRCYSLWWWRRTRRPAWQPSSNTPSSAPRRRYRNTSTPFSPKKAPRY